MTPPPPTTIEPVEAAECPYCPAHIDTEKSLWWLSVGDEETASDIVIQCSGCGMSGPAKAMEELAIEAWNNLPRRPTPQPTREAALKTGFIITHHGDVRILRDRGPDSYELRECKIEAITFGIHPVAAPKPTEEWVAVCAGEIWRRVFGGPKSIRESDIEHIIAQHYTAPAEGWIKCSDRLPEIGEEVQVYCIESVYPEKPRVKALARFIPYEEAKIGRASCRGRV